MKTPPSVITKDMIEVDRLMMGKFGIALPMMMENAGRNLAELVRRNSGGLVQDLSITVAAGRGNNGGGGLVAARHLYNWGSEVAVLLPEGPPGGEISALKLKIDRKAGIEVLQGEDSLELMEDWEGHTVLDAIIGYGLQSDPRGWTAEMVEIINSIGSAVISLDLLTGLDGTSGEIFDPCIRADATMTLALPKTGLLEPGSRRVVGDLYIADIGVPEALYAEIGIRVGPIFSGDTIVKVEI